MNSVNPILCVLFLFVSHFDSFGPFGDSRFSSRKEEGEEEEERLSPTGLSSLFFAFYLLDREDYSSSTSTVRR